MSVNYTRINWEDSPSTQTPLNAENLNAMDSAIDELAGAVNDLDSVPGEVEELQTDITELKNDLSELEAAVAAISFDIVVDANGHATIERTDLTDTSEVSY